MTTITKKIMKVCCVCEGTGMEDKIKRGLFAPGTCHTCHGRGWREIERGYKAMVENRQLASMEKLTCAYMHFIRGIEQQDLATIYDVNSGRVSEACREVGEALGFLEPRVDKDVLGTPMDHGPSFQKEN